MNTFDPSNALKSHYLLPTREQRALRRQQQENCPVKLRLTGVKISAEELFSHIKKTLNPYIFSR